MSKLVPVLFLIFGLFAGGGAAWMMQPEPVPDGMVEETMTAKTPRPETAPGELEFVKLSTSLSSPWWPRIGSPPLWCCP